MSSKKTSIKPKIGVMSSHLAILDKVLTKKHEDKFKKYKNQDSQTENVEEAIF
jgi:hypothetical protein